MRSFFLVVLLSAPAAARQSSIAPEMDKVLMEGIDAIYRMDFPAADKAAEKAIALQPDYPYAYLGQAATDLIRFTYGTEASDPSVLESFEKKIDHTVEVSDAWLKKHPRDADVLMIQGSAHGISSRLALVRRDWLSAFTHGRKAMRSIRQAIKEDPELWDAYLGTGMFDYYVDTIPRFAGWLAKVMLGGDRARGLKFIQITAEKGHYAKTAAKLILVEVYTEDEFGARDPAKALELMKGIWAQYPKSPMIHSAYIVSLFEAGQYGEAEKEAQEYQHRVADGRYAPMNKPKGHALAGTISWAAGHKEKALAEFEAGAVTPPGVLRTRWAVWSRIREGQVLDALGRRSDALDAYKAALAERKLWDFKSYVKPCLAKPCLPASPGHFSPPY